MGTRPYQSEDGDQYVCGTGGQRRSIRCLQRLFDAGARSACDGGGTGSGQLVKQKGLKGKVHVVSFDTSPEELQLFKDGYIEALIVQDPFQMGYRGVQSALKAIQSQPVEKRIDTGVAVVTRANMADPAIQQLLHPTGRGG